MDRIRRYIFFLLIGIILALAIYAFIQRQRINRIEHEMIMEQFSTYQEYVSEEYLPDLLNEKTTDELTDMGGVLWGD